MNRLVVNGLGISPVWQKQVDRLGLLENLSNGCADSAREKHKVIQVAIVNLYSKRKRNRDRSSNDVYQYDEVPSTLRSQLRQMYEEAYENYHRSKPGQYFFSIDDNLWLGLVKALRREYGVDFLVKFPRNERAELEEFIQTCSTDQFLDCAELFSSIVRSSEELGQEPKDALIGELNYRFKEASLGFEIIEGELIKIDSTMLHADVLKPAIALLTSSPIFEGAERELFSAFDHYKEHKHKEAIADALKAFESTMKAILEKRSWCYSQSDPASKLIKACLDNGLIPSYMQAYFTGLKSILESGVPTIRNKTSSHGQGVKIQSPDSHLVSYVLYTTAANIKLLIESERALP